MEKVLGSYQLAYPLVRPYLVELRSADHDCLTWKVLGAAALRDACLWYFILKYLEVPAFSGTNPLPTFSRYSSED